jgi:small-conductance mechanosensitive channel
MPYGGQPYGAPPQEHPQGTLILIFGILGIFITIFAPIAWYLGNKARAEIQASGIHYSNEQNVSIGRMLGKIFTIIAIVSIALGIIFWIIVAIAASQS